MYLVQCVACRCRCDSISILAFDTTMDIVALILILRDSYVWDRKMFTFAYGTRQMVEFAHYCTKIELDNITHNDVFIQNFVVA